MSTLLSRLFTSTYISMAPHSSPSFPSRRLAHLTRHLLNSSFSSGELSSVGDPAAAAAASSPAPPASSKGHAAVLVCLFNDPRGDPRVLLTKRASSLSSHSGEVSLPGGKMEEGDADAMATALREAKEEIGLDPELVSIVTVLEPFLSKCTGHTRRVKISILPTGIAVRLNRQTVYGIQNGLNVTPVIGILSNKALFKPVLNKAEVEDIFDAPLEMFLKDDNRKTREMNWMGINIPVQFFDYHAEGKKFVIWGLTAHILTRAASVFLQRKPSFVELPRPRYVSAADATRNGPKS